MTSLSELAQATKARKQGGGLSLEDLAGAAAERKRGGSGWMDIYGDVRTSLGSGIVSGAAALVDLPGAAFNAAGGWAIDALERFGLVSEETGDAAKESLKFGPMGSGSTARDAANAAFDDLPNYEPKTTAGEYAKTVGEFLPGGAISKAPIAMGVIPGVTSEAAGQFAEGRRFPEWMPLIGGADAEPAARAAGAVAGSAIPNAVRAAITPNPADPARVAATRQLNSEGVNVTAGQKTGNEVLKYREALSPRMTQVVADQNQQFTRAALRRIGVNADRATPMVMKKAATDIGKRFDDALAGVTITPERAQVKAALQVVQDYTEATAKPNISPIIRNTANRIVAASRSGRPISGKNYQEWRSQLSKLTVGTDAQLKNAAQGMIDVLDDASEAALAASGTPEKVKAYAEARRMWRDYLAIETAVSRAGEETAAGIFSPQVLRNAIVQQGKRTYVRGERDLGELARAGSTVTGKLPLTGAFPRAVNLSESAQTGTYLGGTALAVTGDPTVSAIIGGVGAAVPAARNALVSSRAGQAYLGNQVAPTRNQLWQLTLPAVTGVATQ